MTDQLSYPTDPDEQPSMGQFVSAVENLTPATTANVAEEVGCGYQSAYYYLNRLAEDELVRKEKIGNSLLWRAE